MIPADAPVNPPTSRENLRLSLVGPRAAERAGLRLSVLENHLKTQKANTALSTFLWAVYRGGVRRARRQLLAQKQAHVSDSFMEMKRGP